LNLIKKKMNDKYILSREKNQIFLKDKNIFINEKINLYHIIIFIFCTIIISSNSEIDNNHLDESIYSYITLKIGEGYYKVYSYDYNKNPKIIYINKKKQTTVTRKYGFKESENSVILIWEKPITNCENMFKSCDKIIEIDLTHFDTSQVTYMEHMFDGCNNLKSIDVSNIDTSKVESMGVMFKDCSSLTSLDLSHFDNKYWYYVYGLFFFEIN